MLQKDLTTYYSNPGDTPFIVHPDGNVEQMNLTKFTPTYLCIIVFQAALEPIASQELVEFSDAVGNFSDLDCQLVGLARDSIHVIKDWMFDMDPDKEGYQPAKFPIISCLNLGHEDYGLIQAIGVPLKDGYPIPSIILIDREDKVRYFASFSATIRRNVEETLRLVAAIKMIDEAKGSQFAPADWIPGKVSITNTKAGVMKYYKDRYGEEGSGEQKNDAQEDFKTTIKKKFESLSARIFGFFKSDDNENGDQMIKKTNGKICIEEGDKNDRKEVIDEIQSTEDGVMEHNIFSASNKDQNPEGLEKGDSIK